MSEASKDKQDKKEKKLARKRRRQRLIPPLCNVLGLTLMVLVIALTIPLAVPNLMGYEVYNVVSGSMEPEIPRDSVVYVKAVDGADVQEGEIIAFYRRDKLTVHRVVANSTVMGEFDTKGDANEENDPDPVPYDDLVGIVTVHVPWVGKFMALYASNVGKVYLVMALACGVMLNFLAARLRAEQRLRIIRELAMSKAAAASGVSGEATSPEAAADAAEASEKAEARRKTFRRIRTVAIVLLSIVFLGSAAGVYFIYHERAEADRIYTDAAHQFMVENETAAAESKKTIAPIVVDFEKLCGENEDVVGWIYCADTNINYPVLHGKNNDEYLRHDYTREYNIDGSIFVDADNAKGFTDANTIIYGHHMLTGAMFATLEDWAEQDYYEKHSVMWLLTPEQDYQVVLVSGHHVSANSDMYEIYRDHDEDFGRFLHEVEEASDFEPVEDATINPERNYIMLSTCAYVFDNARYVLHGKLVPVDSAGGVAK